MCLDLKDLNHAVKREHYPLPTLEYLTIMLCGAKYFSVLDATPGYWQIKLDEESDNEHCLLIVGILNFKGCPPRPARQ